MNVSWFAGLGRLVIGKGSTVNRLQGWWGAEAIWRSVNAFFRATQFDLRV